jgi:hypothetical protein
MKEYGAGKTEYSTAVRRRVILAVIACNLMPAAAYADLYDDYINSVSKRPFVAFLARNSPGSSGFPGHSYVGIGVELDNGLLVYERLFGYFPVSESVLNEVKAVFTNVSGDLHSKIEDVAWQVELRIPVDSAKHDAALAVADRWKASDPKYNLLANGGKNCSSFAAEVAQAVGLKTPSGAGSTLPVNYIMALKKLNP